MYLDLDCPLMRPPIRSAALAPGAANRSSVADVTASADVAPSKTRNVFERLRGQTEERIVLVTHTDGNTWVQENGIAAPLALAAYFAALRVPPDREHE